MYRVTIERTLNATQVTDPALLVLGTKLGGASAVTVLDRACPICSSRLRPISFCLVEHDCVVLGDYVDGFVQ
jgi:hypothetical protein